MNGQLMDTVHLYQCNSLVVAVWCHCCQSASLFGAITSLLGILCTMSFVATAGAAAGELPISAEECAIQAGDTARVVAMAMKFGAVPRGSGAAVEGVMAVVAETEGANGGA
jgi:hypothetical protein